MMLGLSCGCSELDDSGNCVDTQPCGQSVSIPNQPAGSEAQSQAYCQSIGWTFNADGSCLPASKTAPPAGSAGVSGTGIVAALALAAFAFVIATEMQPG